MKCWLVPINNRLFENVLLLDDWMDPVTRELVRSCFLWSSGAEMVWEHEQALVQVSAQELVQVLADKTCFDSIEVLLALMALMGYS